MSPPPPDDRAALLRQAIRLKKAGARKVTPPLEGRPQDVPAVLGHWQRSLWLLQQLEPDASTYNLASAQRVATSLRVKDLEHAFRRLTDRHRILRSTFRDAEGSVQQVIHRQLDNLAVERFSAPPGQVEAVAAKEARRPFDLAEGPLIRLLWVDGPTGPGGLLVLVLHHILADERSLGRLWNELAALYDGREPAPVEPFQYDDYVARLQPAEAAQHAADLAFWRRQLEPWPDPLVLPFERPRRRDSGGQPAVAEGRLLRRTLEADLVQGLRQVAAGAGATPFAVFLLAFRWLLQRYAEGRDIAIATPVSRRQHAATAEMIGYFLNPVPLRFDVDDELLVEAAIGEVHRHVRGAMGHGSLPFDALVESLSPPRQGDRHPIFQTMFVYQESAAAPALDGQTLAPVWLDLGTSKFDLTLFASESAIAVEYRLDRFDGDWMERLLVHYETLLGRLVEGVREPVRRLSILPSDEAERLHRLAMGELPETLPDAALASAPPLPQQIRRRALASPAAPAVQGAELSWTYGELARMAEDIARRLQRLGVEPGDPVGLFVERSPAMIGALLGCLWAGAAYVPLDPAYPSARTDEVLRDAGVKALVSRGPLRSRLDPGTIPWVDLDVPAPDDGTPFSLPDIAGHHPAYILYTSGSTGRPKGVVITHDNLRASNGVRPIVYIRPPGRFLLLSSVAFDSSVAGIFWTLANGGTLVLPDDDSARDPRCLAQLIRTHRVTSLLCVPSLYAHLLDGDAARLTSLETVIVAGESCPAQLVDDHFERLPRTRLFNEYGPTEATVWATVHEIRPGDGVGPIPIGRPIPGVRVEVLDADGRPVPVGIAGQGWISGPTVANGYWRQPDLSAQRFVERRHVQGASAAPSRTFPGGPSPTEIMYRTGDRMMWSHEGRLLFLGRVDEQIKLRGFRIEPGDIEDALMAAAAESFPAVDGAAVVLRSPQQLVAFLAPLDDGVDTSSLRRELARRLPEYMVPQRLVALPELPRLPNGKLDRQRLRELPVDDPASREAKAEHDTGRASEALLSDSETVLLSLWRGLLGRGDIDLDDNFFQLGGHSLLAVEMATAITRDLGVSLAPSEVFQHPTVRGLAQRIAQRDGGDALPYAHLFPIQPGGRGAPLIFSIPHFFSHAFAQRFRGKRPVYGLRGIGLRPEGNRGRWRTLRALAVDSVDEIQRRFPEPPYLMVGYSFGASMAVEAVRLMEERGIAVERLILIAPMAIDVYRWGPLSAQIDGLRQGLDSLSPGQALGRFLRQHHPLDRRFYSTLRRRLITQSWRRILCWTGDLRRRFGLPLTPRILHADVRLERFRLHRGYRPGTVHTPTVIFNAEEPSTDAAATWRPYFAGPFDVQPIPDPHLDDAAVREAKERILHHMQDLESS